MKPFIYKPEKALAFASLFLFALMPSLSAQTGAAKSLAVGNRWIYLVTEGDSYNPRKERETVRSDTMIANRVYAIIARDYRFSPSPFERADSSKIYAFVRYDSSEYTVCDFNAEVGDTIGRFVVVTTWAGTFWGRPRRFVRHYYEFSYLINELVEYVEGVGIIYQAIGGLAGNGYRKKLAGAVLDGQAYGDTALTTVLEQPKTLPSTFYLLPPHPNPFKKETTIPFHLSNSSLQNVVIEIYAMTGRSVVTLLDQPLLAGEYPVKWKGADREGKPVAGGIYVCRLSTERTHQVRKILLLR